MAVPAVNPLPGVNTVVTTGLTAVLVANGGVGGGYITNPLLAADQGLPTAEPLYIDPVGGCAPIAGSLEAGGTIIALQPGQSWSFIGGQTTQTFANATSSGHRFTAVYWTNS